MLMQLSLARLEGEGHKATWKQRGQGGISLIQPPGAPREPDARHESVSGSDSHAPARDLETLSDIWKLSNGVHNSLTHSVSHTLNVSVHPCC